MPYPSSCYPSHIQRRTWKESFIRISAALGTSLMLSSNSPHLLLPHQDPSLHFPPSHQPRLATISSDLLCCCSYSPSHPPSRIIISSESRPPVAIDDVSCSSCVILHSTFSHAAILHLPASVRVVPLPSAAPQPLPPPPSFGCVVWSAGDPPDLPPLHM